MNRIGFQLKKTSTLVLLFFSTICVSGQNHSHTNCTDEPGYLSMTESLLRQWCDGMLRELIVDSTHPELNGTLNCQACGFVHSRSMDAVYPFMKMAHITGDNKYIEAAKAVFKAAEHVSQPDGSWTVIPDPKSWRGITIFGAIATAEALHYHGNLLDSVTRHQWTERLRLAAGFIYNNITSIEYSNVNYGGTAIYGMYLLGHTLHEPLYIERAKELANAIKPFFTQPNYLLYGETKPIHKKSARGLYGIDLGYNVEETLNSIVMYALAVNDTALIKLAAKSLKGHLEFMLPDGGWDNSWGTRQAKWSYWGSRTTDGCMPAYGMMAHINPAFGTAAYRNTKLLQQCTHNGLLHGGPHYVSHSVLPCVHHTFTHAKSLALMLDMADKLPDINNISPLPRELETGLKYFPETDTWLSAIGEWRGTITSYDHLYVKENVQQASGGALSILWHNKAGLLLTASMANYFMVEKNNMQPMPGNEDFALTPRIEVVLDNVVYSNTFDLEATVKTSEKKNKLVFEVETQLKNNRNKPHLSAKLFYKISYTFDPKTVTICIQNTNSTESRFFLPILSKHSEKVTQLTATKIEIEKPEGIVVVSSDKNLNIKHTDRKRVFNLVPGFEAVPVYAVIPQNSSVTISIAVR